MSTQGIKFYSNAYGAAAASTKSTTEKGSIVFDKTSKSIFVNGVRYGGGLKDASYENNVLKIWKADDADATPSVSLDFSSLATSKSVMAVFNELSTEIDAIETGTGLGTDGKYTANTSTNYINNATSLKNADEKLDAAIKAVANSITEHPVTDVKIGETTIVADKVATIVVEGTYNASTNKVATESTVTNVIGGLDYNTEGAKNLATVSGDVITLATTIKEEDGVIAVSGTQALAAVAKTGTAADVTITDTNDKITATTVEGALEELVTSISNNNVTIKSGEKVLSFTENTKELSSTLTIDIEKGTDNKEYIVLKGINSAEVSKVDASAFVKDGMITSVAWKKDGDVDTNILLITWNTDADKTPTTTEVDMSKFIDTYTSGNETALTVEGYVITPNTGAVAENAGTLTTGGQVYTAVAATKGQDIQTITGETAVTNDSYVNVAVTATKGASDNNYTLSTTSSVVTKNVADATTESNGLALAKDVKDYVDGNKTTVDNKAATITVNDTDVTTIATVGGTNITAKAALYWEEFE